MLETNGPLPVLDWSKFPLKISQVAQRLIGVQIECQPATDLLRRHARKEVCVYADPPYILATRTTSSYKHEMTNQEHKQLLDVLDEHPGPVILSGYDHPMYSERLRHWRRETKQVQAEAGASRTEVIWINPIAADWGQQKLF